MSADRGSVLFVGVGGQGVVLASAVAADAARRSGMDTKQSEVHGMSQRGGVVSSHLRFGPEVHSPLIASGEADAILALEWNEALRALPMLKPGGTAIVNAGAIRPPGAFRDRRDGHIAYPALLLSVLRRHVADARVCDAAEIAERAGNAKAVNGVLLGVLADLLPFSDEAWDAAVASNVPPKALDANREAFRAGRALRFPEDTLYLDSAVAASPEPSLRVRAAGEVEIVDAWCKGEDCSICVRACPEYVLGFDGARAVRVVRADACTACRVCELLCPDFAIAIHEKASA